MSIRAIIAEDELVAMECLKSMAEANEIHVVAQCSDGKETLRALRNYRPDLLFLDVQMPSLDGFGVLSELEPGSLPAVIFTTAHDQYAVRAFDCNAVDYLLKPFEEDRFRRAVDRAKAALENRSGPHTLTKELVSALQQVGHVQTSPRRLAIRSAGEVTLLRVDEIDWIEAAGNYVHIRVGGNIHVLRNTISAMEGQLDPAKFLRIHRSLNENVDRIQRLESCGYGEYLIVLHNGKKLSLSRRYRDQLDRFLGEVLGPIRAAGTTPLSTLEPEWP